MGSGSGVGKSSGVVLGVGTKNLLGVTSFVDIFLKEISGVDFLFLNILLSLQIVIPCNIIPHE
jgi:hypothetical protein